MTDDKVAGEAMVVLMKEIIKMANTEYAEGRKDERERCLKIVNDFCPCHDDIVQIEKRIREG